MVTPTDVRATTMRSRTAERRRELMGLALLIGIVWGLSQVWTSWQTASLAAQLKGRAQGDDILMLTTSTCPYCAAARRWLSEHNIAYRECNVEEEAACAAEYVARGSPGVPLMKAKGQWQLGFDPQWLVAVLAADPQASSQTQP